MNKIFGIGMPKTGTSSLNKALEILGFRSCHYPSDPTTVAELRDGNYKLSILQKFDALTDVPIPAIFAQLDSNWPDSKFILTVRDLDSWLESCMNAPFNEPGAFPKAGTVRDFYRTLLYGCVGFNKERWAWVYEKHLILVKNHFAGEKKNQLLNLDITNGEGWEKLCPFLKVPIPDQEFPHANKRRNASINHRQSAKRNVSRLRNLIKK